jgi:hypothetical protein
MEEKKTLRIDVDELCSAMEDGSYEHNYYLDMKTGEILLISDYMDEGEIEKLSCMIDEDPERYKRIPRAEPHVGYEDMEDFIATVEDGHLVELLEVAIAGKGAFRRFKDVLARYPKEREKWFHFKDEIAQQRVLEWLDDIGISLAEE